MTRIRVLVVEDSLTIRQHLVNTVRADPELELVGEADNGQLAIELCQALRPNVVTLDMMLHGLNGLEATEQIMAHHPTPILIVSASVNRGELFRTYDALAAGAVDVLEKPTGQEPEGDWERRYLAALKLVSRIKVITHIRGRMTRAPRPLLSLSAAAGSGFRVVALAASTGGPSAVSQVLRALSAPFPLPILVVVHIGAPFGAAFAEWLDGQSSHRVIAAPQGMLLTQAVGQVLLAPADRHLSLHGGSVRLTSDPDRHSCRPSADTLFEAVAREYGRASIACLMTGMGRDGAAGMLEIRRTGGLTIAQDEQSSVVHGMPREAILLGAAERVLSLAEIGPAIDQAVRVEQRRTR